MGWDPGDTVVLREVWQGRLWTARPQTVVEDAEAQQMFCCSPGMRWKAPATQAGEPLRLPTRDWVLADRVWSDYRLLSFAWPGVAHAVLAYWHAAGDEFAGWYINLQTPLTRTPLGFDYFDHALDIVVAPNGSSWRWKDEDELEEAVALGLFSAAEAEGFRAEGERAVRRLLDHDPPFEIDWSSWRPDQSWSEPELPAGWDVLEPAATGFS
jgi:predicted RNA-binding protein associated with RNAse of E/G family